ncbi:MAG: DJ-1/PfpI family protein [Clostridiales bacterium]|mgnify:CR=1 FL=1|jgi:4-methyl-5(b-hydroxyethyl)-thiazole monophosphate biosynthesis|nr:DJ-1/PfpI family protein [Clostridiales bacterium]
MVYIVLGNGFEEIEAIAPMDILRRAGIDAQYAGVLSKTVTGAHGIAVTADTLIENVDLKNTEMLVLPGGAVNNAGNYGRDAHALRLISDCVKSGKKVAAICAGPTVLGSLDLLDGKRAVCYPGMESRMTGATPVKGEKVVLDGNILTAQGPGSAIEFGLNLVAVLKGTDAAESVRSQMYYTPVKYAV